MVIFVWGAGSSSQMARPPDDAHEIFVVGKQWMWKLQHLEGRREINELHVPVGQPVKLTMTSEDVIHSFFVPAFRVKADVLPGPLHHHLVRGHQGRRVPPLLRRVLRHRALRHDRPGRGHGAGRLPGLAQQPAERRRPRARRRRPAGAAVAGRGRRGAVHQKACATCHQPQGGARGPSLVGVFGKPVQAAGRQHGRSPTRPTCASRSSTRRPRSSPASSRSCRPSRARSAKSRSCS